MTYSIAFDSGSASSIAGTTTVTITPAQVYSTGWGWFAVSNDALGGTTPTFQIPLANYAHAPYDAARWCGCWGTALDGDTWHKFDNQSADANYVYLSNNSAFPAGTIYITLMPLYPFSRVTRKVAAWITHPYAHDTTSGTNGIVGYSTSRACPDGSGRTIPALAYYGFKISKNSGNTKNVAILTGRNHPNEIPGSFQLEGAVDFLLSGDPEAEFLLDWFDFYVYPCVNPQGAWSGWYRSAPCDASNDHNRVWDTTGSNEDVDILKAVMSTDTGGTVTVGIDYHSHQDPSYAQMITVFDDTAALVIAYDAEIDRFGAESVTTTASSGTLMGFFRDSLSASLYMTQETGDANARGPVDWEGYGANSMKALAQLTAKGKFANGPASGYRSFNGTTDRVDWASIFQPVENSPLTISLFVNATRNNTYQYMFQAGDSAGATGFIAGGYSTAGTMRIAIGGTTSLVHQSANTALTTGAWIHFIFEWNGPITSAATAKIYKNGVETTYSTTTNGAGMTAATGRWSIGGRFSDDTRNFQGGEAQVAVWDRILSPTEKTQLSRGYLPSAIATPRFYIPLSSTSLTDTITSTVGTADGTTYNATGGPGMIYSTQQAANVLAVAPNAAAAAPAPTISAGANISAVPATASALAPAPTISGRGRGNVQAVPCTAPASAPTPAVKAAASLTVPVMTATARAIPPAVKWLQTPTVERTYTLPVDNRTARIAADNRAC